MWLLRILILSNASLHAKGVLYGTHLGNLDERVVFGRAPLCVLYMPRIGNFGSQLTWVSLADRLGGEEKLVVRVGLDDSSLAKRGGGVRGGSVGGLGGHLAALLGWTETNGCKKLRE